MVIRLLRHTRTRSFPPDPLARTICLEMASKENVSLKTGKQTLLQKIVPIPQEFYAGNKDEDLIIPKKQIIPMAIVLQFMQWGAFIAFFTYYSLPPSFIRESTVQAQWDFGGSSWNCTPMMSHDYYAMRWNHDTCKSFLQPPSEATVTLSQNVKADPAAAADDDVSGPAWRYHPFLGTGAGAKVLLGPAEEYVNDPSLSDDAVSEKIRQVLDPLKELNTCGLDGFLQKANMFRSTLISDPSWPFDIYSPNFAHTSTPPPPVPPAPPPPLPPAIATSSVCCGGESNYLVEEPSCQRGVFDFSGVQTQCSNFLGEGVSSPSGDRVHVGDDIDGITHTTRYVSPNMIYDKGLESNGQWVTRKQDDMDRESDTSLWADPDEGIDETDPAQYDSTTSFWLYNDGAESQIVNCIRCCVDVGHCECCGEDGGCPENSCCYCGPPPPDYEEYIDPYDDPTNPEYWNIRYALPAGYYEPCETTQAEAIAMFKSYLERHDPCEWTKHNSPYNCERAGPLGVGQRFSLAYANALLAYTVVSAAIVNIFFAAQKRKAEGRDVEHGENEQEFTEISLSLDANKNKNKK